MKISYVVENQTTWGIYREDFLTHLLFEREIIEGNFFIRICVVPRVTVKVLRNAKGEKRDKTTGQLDAYNKRLKTMKNCYKAPSQKSGHGRLCVVVACLREVNYDNRV